MILKSCRLRFACLFLVVLSVPPRADAQEDPAGLARRIGAVSAIASREYALGVREGRVVSGAELEETRLFLDEAQRLAERLPDDIRDAVTRRIGAVVRATEALVAPGAVAQLVADLRGDLAARLGIALDPLPSAPVALARGEAVYRTNCASCHGAGGTGDGPAAAGLAPAPADLTDRDVLARTSPLDFFRKISVGVAGTAMRGYEQALSLDDRWAVSLYAASLRYAGESRATGRRWFLARCPDCLAELGDGVALLAVSDDSLAALLGARTGQAAPPEALAFARTAGAADRLGEDRVLAARRAVRRATDLVGEAVTLAHGGDAAGALGRALDAYMAFERVEREVGARNGQAARSVERSFGAFRVALVSGDSAARAAAAADVERALDVAARVATHPGSANVLFGQSVVIILREGLEAILIIGALMAFLVRAGAEDRRRHLAAGAGLAVVASLVTAGLFATILRGSLAHQEAFEGVTMLLASVVLFGVASWMVSKVEAERWRTFVRARIEDALSSGRTLALAGVAFLAVYREGVETILFYAALLGTAKSAPGVAAVWIGLAAGGGVLALLYAGMQRWGMRIPIRPFFAVTGMLLTVMAVSFAGQGVAELQGAGWVPATPLRLPTLPALGIFPTVQTTLAQVALGLAFVIALLWAFRYTGPVARAR